MKLAVLLILFPPVLAGYVGSILLGLDIDKSYTQYLLVVPLSYFLGSIPWGYMIIKARQGVDVREYGSGRIGATNVLRVAGPRFAVLVLLLDVSKGLLAIFLARAASDSAMVEAVSGLAVLAGHNWPFYMRFRGGRGIGPGAGGVILLVPLACGIGLVFFALTAYITRYVSLSSLLGTAVLIIATAVMVAASDTPLPYLLYTGLGGLAVLWQHKDNIQRIVKGTERRLGQKSERLAS